MVDAYNKVEAAAALLGITLVKMASKDGYKPSIHVRAGDACSMRFDGLYRYAKGATKAIKAHAPGDDELLGIAQGLQDTQKKYRYLLRATLVAARPGMDISVFQGEKSGEALGEAAQEINGLLHRFAGWSGTQLASDSVKQ